MIFYQCEAKEKFLGEQNSIKYKQEKYETITCFCKRTIKTTTEIWMTLIRRFYRFLIKCHIFLCLTGQLFNTLIPGGWDEYQGNICLNPSECILDSLFLFPPLCMVQHFKRIYQVFFFYLNDFKNI